ncbi:MAG: hypothetical protein JRE23_02655 [Deltaproteobacteria bacterium]|nr:hypothetical protein [Deltaproteobacteria bacterium]
MGFLTGILGTPKVVDTVADTVKSGMGMLDNAFYTDQEKAKDAGKVMETWLAIQKATANENSVRSITRRILAWIIMGTFVLLVVAACIVWKFDPGWAAYIKDTIVDTKLAYLALIVGFFYFGSYGLGTLIKK